MKKFISCAMLLIIAVVTFSQQTKPSTTLTKQDYLQKSKKQKTAGWILLGGGALMTTIGTVVVANEITDEWVNIFDPNLHPAKKDETLGSILFYGGIVAMGVSIPFFIAAGKNKRKAAASVSFKMDDASIVQGYRTTKVNYPAFSVKIHL